MIKQSPIQKKLKMSVQDFTNFGTSVIGYIRPVNREGQTVFALYGADGAPMCIETSEALAVVAARQRDIMPLLVN